MRGEDLAHYQTCLPSVCVQKNGEKWRRPSLIHYVSGHEVDVGDVEVDIQIHMTASFLRAKTRPCKSHYIVVRLLPPTSTSRPPDIMKKVNETRPSSFIPALLLPCIIVNTNRV